MVVKINGTEYPATIAGKMNDLEWDGRSSKTITLEMTHDTALEVFQDGVEWSIVDGEEEWDNSDYSFAGDITDHRDGTVSVKMGKPTDLETILELLYANELENVEGETE